MVWSKIEEQCGCLLHPLFVQPWWTPMSNGNILRGENSKMEIAPIWSIFCQSISWSQGNSVPGLLEYQPNSFTLQMSHQTLGLALADQQTKNSPGWMCKCSSKLPLYHGFWDPLLNSQFWILSCPSLNSEISTLCSISQTSLIPLESLPCGFYMETQHASLSTHYISDLNMFIIQEAFPNSPAIPSSFSELPQLSWLQSHRS